MSNKSCRVCDRETEIAFQKGTEKDRKNVSKESRIHPRKLGGDTKDQ